MCPIFLPVEILLKSLDKWVKWEIHAFLEATIIVLIETVWLNYNESKAENEKWIT